MAFVIEIEKREKINKFILKLQLWYIIMKFKFRPFFCNLFQLVFSFFPHTKFRTIPNNLRK